ncbi:MAG: hypothetical protein EOO07_18915 [Chitinophagaceae bacterium]|nr:MAG: hypothetical protein EOO07_18915 [Chitinophagaceae bacterium]
MKIRTLFILIFFSIVVASCELNEQPRPTNDMQCPPKTCTLEFASISVKFIDKAGNSVTVSDFKSINSRTGLAIKYAGPYTISGVSNYTVATDGDLKEFTDTGDEVVVSGTNPATGQTKSATFSIAGGCACHIRKISGPSQITFD